ncbi:hypothetical protein PENTCL1PPCAC_27530 [Pristionchus entomophagus]|uniref:Uncharacterized protein n=1 Tax=Pristionchus entomophagus TaxID=358040 RepID=A0AAV5UEF8_9BILA|nr:hypothetical protein PENTCL1PPCAC_27530 [Pristionchus entomophagus]
MGSSSSHPSPDMGYSDHHQPAYGMDMNALFRDGIPRMIKVADDMHRMTNYIMDLRNMTLGLVAISVIGVLGFLLLRFASNRNRRRRRLSRHHHEDGPHASTLPRYYNYQSQYGPEPWDRPKSTFSHHSIEEKKLHDTRGSPEDRKPPNGTMNTYKPYTPVGGAEHDSSDESRGAMNDSFPSSRATTVPNSHQSHHHPTTVLNPMLITQAATPTPPPLSQGRSSRSSSWSRTSRTPTRTIKRQEATEPEGSDGTRGRPPHTRTTSLPFPPETRIV